MTQSFKDYDWLVVQEGEKRVILTIGSILNFHFEITCIIFPILPFSHTHTHIIYVYINHFFIIPYAVNFLEGICLA